MTEQLKQRNGGFSQEIGKNCGADLPGYVTVFVNVTVKQSIYKETDIRCGFGVVVHSPGSVENCFTKPILLMTLHGIVFF